MNMKSFRVQLLNYVRNNIKYYINSSYIKNNSAFIKDVYIDECNVCFYAVVELKGDVNLIYRSSKLDLPNKFVRKLKLEKINKKRENII